MIETQGLWAALRGLRPRFRECRAASRALSAGRLALARSRDVGDWLNDEPGWKEKSPPDGLVDETEGSPRRGGGCFEAADCLGSIPPDLVPEGCLRHGGHAVGDLPGCDVPALDCGGCDVPALDCGGCG